MKYALLLTLLPAMAAASILPPPNPSTTITDGPVAAVLDAAPWPFTMVVGNSMTLTTVFDGDPPNDPIFVDIAYTFHFAGDLFDPGEEMNIWGRYFSNSGAVSLPEFTAVAKVYVGPFWPTVHQEFSADVGSFTVTGATAIATIATGVAEPGTWLMMLGGLAGLCVWRGRVLPCR